MNKTPLVTYTKSEPTINYSALYFTEVVVPLWTTDFFFMEVVQIHNFYIIPVYDLSTD